MNIQPIVEGHGEVEAVPVLLRRLIAEASAYHIQVNYPIRKRQSQLLQEQTLKAAVRLAKIQENCAAILVLFEDEDGCPATLGPQLNEWAQEEAGNIPCRVTLAHREYEAWFLATIESLCGRRGIRNDATSHDRPEAVRDAKGAIEERMHDGTFYSEVADQPALTAIFDMRVAYQRARSFRHLVKAFGDLANAIGPALPVWPPPDWEP